MLHNIIQVVEEKIMARTKSDNVQINISIPTGWKTELENLARIYSVEEGKTITFLDLMRRGCLLYTSPSPRDRTRSRMPSSA